jgi:hypothetical protein
MNTLILPVGHCVGAQPAGIDDRTSLLVHRGGQLVELTEAELAAWFIAASAVTPERPTTRAAIERLLADAGHHNPAGLVDDLLIRQLLAQTPRSGPAAAAFARTYHLRPSLLGLGRSRRRAGCAGIGLPGREVVSVSAAVYELWAQAATHPTLWRACESIATSSDGATSTPENVLAVLLAELHLLLATAAAWLDPVKVT